MCPSSRLLYVGRLQPLPIGPCTCPTTRVQYHIIRPDNLHVLRSHNRAPVYSYRALLHLHLFLLGLLDSVQIWQRKHIWHAPLDTKLCSYSLTCSTKIPVIINPIGSPWVGTSPLSCHTGMDIHTYFLLRFPMFWTISCTASSPATCIALALYSYIGLHIHLLIKNSHFKRLTLHRYRKRLTLRT